MWKPRSMPAKVAVFGAGVLLIAIPSAALGASLDGSDPEQRPAATPSTAGAVVLAWPGDSAVSTVAASTVAASTVAASTVAAAAAQAATARNVILLLGDGMGDSEITLARNYQVGASGHLAMDTLPIAGAYTTYSVQKKHPSLPDYVTDSAASASGWATGHKTYDGAISVLPSSKPVPTILELAKKAGYRTGNVTTAELQDATPAAMGAHVVSRTCKGPASMADCPKNAKENGDAGSIAEQLVMSGTDVMLGGGRQYFDQKVKAGTYRGKTVLDQARARGYRVVGTATGLSAASANKPLLGVFAKNELALAWVGPKPTRTGTPAARCRTNTTRPTAQPTLATMASKAIALLDQQTRTAPKGFFLQIEGASIDKQNHAANPCGQIGETVRFDSAVKVALAYQKQHPDTLVVVTADHGHTSQIVDAGSKTMGYTATLTTVDGAKMTVSYATATISQRQQHTGTEVRIAAVGPSATRVQGVTDQTDLFRTFTVALGLG